jgi:ABC-type multidrug transport system fused ATPase/permease subunit
VAIRSFKLLSSRAQQTFITVAFSQIVIGFLDLFAILIIGIIGSLAVAGISGFKNPKMAAQVIDIIGISNFSFQKQIAILGCFSALFLITKTLVSMWITKKTLGFLSNQGRIISKNLLSNLLRQKNIKLVMPEPQQSVFVFVRGISEISVGLLGSILNLISDFSLLVILVIGLLILDPITAVFSLILFSSLAVALYVLLHKSARNLGSEEARLTIAASDFMIDLTNIIEQIQIRDLQENYLEKFDHLQSAKTRNDADIAFLPLIGKYLLETGIVIGAILLCLVEFILKDSQQAIASLAIFLTAGTRIMPALLRLQQSSMKLRLTEALSKNAFELIDQIADSDIDTTNESFIESVPLVINHSVRASGVGFRYSEQSTFALNNIDFELNPGMMMSIVGPSGSGKSTLANLLVGSLTPTSGVILVQNETPSEISRRLPGTIGYVPQDIPIINGSLRENITLGLQQTPENESHLLQCILNAQLTKLLTDLPAGIDTDLRKEGISLSGGERQRLGIARALFSRPSLLILDEATSALDSETEYSISKAIQELRGKITIVMIAHRLSTVKSSDQIIYLENGTIVASGSFDELRKIVPSFDTQAGLMGL